MKNFFILLIVSALLGSFISCNNNSGDKTKDKITKKAETLDELREKYGNHEFKDCDELLTAGDEMIDVYIATVDRAYEGDSLAKKDLDRFDSFMSTYDAMAAKITSECPEQFEEWAAKTEERISKVVPKLDKIYRSDFEAGTFVYDEELEKQIEKEVEELNKQVEEALGSEQFTLKD